MTITCQPMDATAGAPAYSATNERQANAALYGGGGGVALAARSGFRPGTPSNILTATSTTWTLNPCSAVISPGAATAQGSYRWSTDAAVTGAVTASDATYDRKDIVYIQVSDSSSGDGSGALTANVSYLAGTPSATPSAPGTPPRSFLVGTITVPKTTGGAPTVALNPAVFVAAGGIQPISSQAEQDALTAYDGLRIDRLDLNRQLRHDGTKWVGGKANITLDGLYVPYGAGYATPRVSQNADGDVILEGALQRATGGTLTMLANDPKPLGTIPAGYRPAENRMFIVPTTTAMGGWARVYVSSSGAMTWESPTAFSNVAASSAVIWLDDHSWTTS